VKPLVDFTTYTVQPQRYYVGRPTRVLLLFIVPTPLLDNYLTHCALGPLEKEEECLLRSMKLGYRRACEDGVVRTTELPLADRFRRFGQTLAGHSRM